MSKARAPLIRPLRLPLWSMERDYHIYESFFQTFLRHLCEAEVIALEKAISLPALLKKFEVIVTHTHELLHA